MKEFVVATFDSRDAAEKAINRLHNQLKVPNEDISYAYRNTAGETVEMEASEISTSTPAEGAKTGALTGGAIGALAGIAAVVGVMPVLGPLVAAGPIASALGLTGAIGTTAVGAVAGAAAGGLIGALINMGVGEEHAQRYADSVQAGNILVAAHIGDQEATNAANILKDSGATDVDRYTLRV